jgi:hypothetical protein
MYDESKPRRGTQIAIWVFLLLVMGSLYCVHYKILDGIYFVYAMPIPIIFAIICEVAAWRRRGRERRTYSRPPR